MVKNPPSVRETQVQSLSWEVPWRREWLPTPVFLPGQFHGQRSLAGYTFYGIPKRQNRTERLTHNTIYKALPAL